MNTAFKIADLIGAVNALQAKLNTVTGDLVEFRNDVDTIDRRDDLTNLHDHAQELAVDAVQVAELARAVDTDMLAASR